MTRATSTLFTIALGVPLLGIALLMFAYSLTADALRNRWTGNRAGKPDELAAARREIYLLRSQGEDLRAELALARGGRMGAMMNAEGSWN